MHSVPMAMSENTLTFRRRACCSGLSVTSGLSMSIATTYHEAILPEEATGLRLDRALALALPDFSRTRIQALIRAGKVCLDGEICLDPGAGAREGLKVTLEVPPPEPATPLAEDIPLDIVYEDEHLLVLDKPAGLVVHPGAGNWSGTLVNALLAHCKGSLSGIGGVERPGIVHRIDKDTSGLLVVAKNDHAHHHLQKQFADHGKTGCLDRRYYALVWGVPSRPYNTVDAPLDRDPRNREKIAVCKPGKGRDAVTHWQVVQTFALEGKPFVSLIECKLETGRTHQIRVHMAHIGHPLLGDSTYGTGFASKIRKLPPQAQEAVNALHRQALHARSLSFAHPATEEEMHFESALPNDLQKLIAILAQM